ncbi:hypothetical protein ANACOL_04133 [Anaerotruncus colihominis DSM 17241]|uniref:Uncharacterized protein n=1 Tax=Anaerotruncus colihominis DSM 17241 TaxID=445972 RepID=B0PGI0_9FIRM|nr:hypothetical protein ANACOL_04133 [Anaerotruncus colihominis DSM 17241]
MFENSGVADFSNSPQRQHDEGAVFKKKQRLRIKGGALWKRSLK